MNNQEWQQIKRVIEKSQRAAMYCSIATVDQTGQPNITPIGTVFLADDQTGFFFDTYSESFKTNLTLNNKACLQAVNSDRMFWLKSMILGKFSDYPGVRLFIEIDVLRPATNQEMALVQQRIRPLKWTKGSQLIWSDFSHVRTFSAAPCAVERWRILCPSCPISSSSIMPVTVISPCPGVATASKSSSAP